MFRGGRGNGPGANDRSSDNGCDDDGPARSSISGRGRGAFLNVDDSRPKDNQNESSGGFRGGFRGGRGAGNQSYDNQSRDSADRENGSSGFRGGRGGMQNRDNDRENGSSGFRGGRGSMNNDRDNDRENGSSGFRGGSSVRGRGDSFSSNYDDNRQQNDRCNDQRESNFAQRGGFRGQSDNYDRQPARENNFAARGGFRGQSERQHDRYNDQRENNFDSRNNGQNNYQNSGDRFQSRNNDDHNDGYNRDGPPSSRGRGGPMNRDTRPPPRDNDYNQQQSFGRNDEYSDNAPVTRGRGGRGASSYDSRQSNDNYRQQFNDRRNDFNDRRDAPRGRTFENREDNYDGPRSGRGGFTSSRGRGNFGNDRDQEGNYDGPRSGRGGFGQGGRNFDNREDNYDGPRSGRGGFTSSRGRGNFGNDQEDNYDGSRSGRGGFTSRGCGNFGNDRDESAPMRGRGGFSRQQDGGRSCYNCGGEGHMSRDCDQPRQERPPRQFIPDSEKKYVPEEVTTEQLFDDANQAKTENNVYNEDNEVTIENFPDHIRVFETWADAEFMPAIIDNITRRTSYLKPREFQAKTIPIVLEGYDVKGQAETGSGKSAAFLLPIIQILAKKFENSTESRGTKVSALIVEPVRELADQLYEEAAMFAAGTNIVANRSIGKTRMDYSRTQLQRGCDLLVVTPGRGGQIVEDDLVDVSELKILVLDEADQLLDEEYQEQLNKIFDKLPPVEKRQTLFFSATLWSEVHELADKLCKPNCVSIRSNSANKRITQKFVLVPQADRLEYVINLVLKIKEETEGEMPKTLIFVASKNQANMLALRFCSKGIKSMTANGDISPEERKRAITEFKKGGYRVMVSTNVSSRGIDINDLSHVINVEVPDPKHKGAKVTYLHRIGRTGRVSHGTATTFFDPDYEVDQQMAEFIIETLKDVNQEVPDFVQAAADPSVSYNRPVGSISEEVDQECLDVAEPEF